MSGDFGMKDIDWFIICKKCGSIKWEEIWMKGDGGYKSGKILNGLQENGDITEQHIRCNNCGRCHSPDMINCCDCNNQLIYKKDIMLLSVSLPIRKQIYKMNGKERITWLKEYKTFKKIEQSVEKPKAIFK